LTWATANVPLLFGAGLAASTVVRVATVSRGDTTTARAIIQFSGTGDVLVGVIVGMVPVVVTYAAVGAWIWWWRRRTWRLVALPLLVSFLVLLIAPVGGITLGVLSSFGFLFVLHGETLDRRAIVGVFVGIVALPLLNGVVVSDEMWLPAEELSVKGSYEVGYVLRDDTEKLVFLRESDRSVVFIARNDILGRGLCKVSGGRGVLDRAFDNRVLDLIGDERGPDYPGCFGT
jgi:hypothetical protein